MVPKSTIEVQKDDQSGGERRPGLLDRLQRRFERRPADESRVHGQQWRLRISGARRRGPQWPSALDGSLAHYSSPFDKCPSGASSASRWSYDVAFVSDAVPSWRVFVRRRQWDAAVRLRLGRPSVATDGNSVQAGSCLFRSDETGLQCRRGAVRTSSGVRRHFRTATSAHGLLWGLRSRWTLLYASAGL